MSLNPDHPDLQPPPDDSALGPEAALELRRKLDPDATRDQIDNPQIAVILDQHLQDLQNGTACSREQLLQRHPEFADELSEYLDGIEMVSGLGVGSDLVPQQLGDFDVSEVIGQGAMGVVYRAYQKSLKRPVALKVLRYAVTGQQASKRFEREAELVATLDHANIVPVYAFGQHEKLHFFAMRLIDGESLAQWNADDLQRRDPKAIATWIAEVARALGHAHQRDVVHRDVKPSNLLKENKGDSKDKIWLTDFGLARRFDDVRMSMTGAMLGTPNYMSPEQAAPARHPIDHRTDIYSLGATLFELLTGRTVFPADTPHAVLAQVLAEEAPLLTDVIPGAHRDLETIVMKCLEKEPRDRYQTANDLAEDLEAYVAGNPIRGRRPGVVERLARWRKQNQETVRWAGATAAATLMLLAVSVAAWLGWQNATTGYIRVQSDQGPIVGRLIDADGNKTPTFTIPMQQRMSVKQGRYQLQTWAKHRIGQTQDLFVRAGENGTNQIKLPDLSLFSDRTIDGIPKLWRRTDQTDGDRDGVVLLQTNGIARLNTVNGKEMWSIDAKQLTAISKSESAAQEKLKKQKLEKRRRSSKYNGRTWEQILLKPLGWRWDDDIQSDSDSRIPKIAVGFPDINNDQEPDLMVAFGHHPTLISLDAETGQRLWRYTALPKHEGDPSSGNLHFRSGGMNNPTIVDDIDGDGLDDVTAQFYSEKERWIDAVSSKTGKRLWRIEMPTDWFDVAKTGGQTANSAPVLLPEGCQIGFRGPFSRHEDFLRGTDWSYFEGRSFRGRKKDLIVPWQSSKLSIEESESGFLIADASAGSTSGSSATNSLLLTVCGSRLVGHDAATGKPSPAFNRGKPLDLGYFPALRPRLVSNHDGQLMGLLLCEMVSIANPRFAKTKPVTRFHLLSLDSAKPIWSFTTDCDPDWTGVSPDWPLIEDLNGDGTPEIIVAAGGELEKRYHQKPSLVCTLQAIDGRTGKAIWDQSQLPMLRCESRQIQNVLVGPDADGDQLDDVYTVCPMVRKFAADDPSSVFIDVLSGVSGQKIRSAECACPIWDSKIELQRPFFWGTSPDGSPQLVLSTYRYGRQTASNGTLFVSTANGNVNHIADGLSVRLQIPYQSDSSTTLFLTAPRDRDNLVGASDLVTVKPQSSKRFDLIGGHFVPAADFDGDGLSDLLNDEWTKEICAISSSDGKVIWKYAFNSRGGSSKVLDADLNGDQIQDVLVWGGTSGHAVGGTSGNTPTKLTCLSGKSGQTLWTKPLACQGNADSLHAISGPVVGNGRSDVYITYKHVDSTDFHRPLRSLRLLRLDGKTGSQRSEVILIPDGVGGSPGRDTWAQTPAWPVLLADFDADGTTDMASVTFDQADSPFLTSWRENGEVNWQKPLATATQKDEHTTRLLVDYIEGTADCAGLLASVGSIAKDPAAAVTGPGSSAGSFSKTVVQWFNAETGELVADWAGGNRLLIHEQNGRRKPALWGGVPFAIRDNKRVLTGVCCEDGDYKKLQVHVLDPHGSQPQEVCQIEASRESMFWNNGEATAEFLIADVDGNGQDELIACDKKHMIATTLATGKELLRADFSSDQWRLIGITKDSKGIELVTRKKGGSRSGTQLSLLDLKTLKPNWSVELPRQARHGTFVTPMRSTEVDSSEPVGPPLVSVNRLEIRQSTLIVPQSSDYRGEQAVANLGRTMPVDPASGLSMAQDPRWVKRVPWSISAGQWHASGFVSYLLQSLIVCLGAVLFPFWFVRRILKRKRWSLKEMFLVPILFALPYAVLNLNLGSFHFNVSNELQVEGFRATTARMLASLYVLPMVVFCWFWLKSLWRGHWRRLGMVSLIAIVIAVALGAIIILVPAVSMSAGSRYQWWDWSHLVLVSFSMNTIGFLLIVFYISRSIYRFFSGLKNRKTVLQTAS